MVRWTVLRFHVTSLLVSSRISRLCLPHSCTLFAALFISYLERAGGERERAGGGAGALLSVIIEVIAVQQSNSPIEVILDTAIPSLSLPLFLLVE